MAAGGSGSSSGPYFIWVISVKKLNSEQVRHWKVTPAAPRVELIASVKRGIVEGIVH